MFTKVCHWTLSQSTWLQTTPIFSFYLRSILFKYFDPVYTYILQVVAQGSLTTFLRHSAFLMHATWPTHLILFNLISLQEDYKTWNYNFSGSSLMQCINWYMWKIQAYAPDWIHFFYDFYVWNQKIPIQPVKLTCLYSIWVSVVISHDNEQQEIKWLWQLIQCVNREGHK